MSQNSQEGEILVLQEHVNHHDFVRVAEERLDLLQYKTHQGDGEKKSFEDVWITSDQANAVHYLDNPLMNCRYLWIRSPQTPDLLSKIYGLLPYYDSEDLLESLADADNHNEAVDAVLRLGVGFTNFDPHAFEAFETCLEHPSASLRRATIQAIAYRSWSECEPLLERVIQTDTDEKVRQFAQKILDSEYRLQRV
jgi:hypothetical protein